MLSDEQYRRLEKLYNTRRFCYVVVFYATGCAFYMYEEGWSLIDAIYFITLTISSVGYGDLEPTSTFCRCFTVIYAIVGLAAIFGVIGEAITEYLEFIQEKALHESRSTKKTSEDIRREENRRMTLSIGVIAIIILGGGGCYTYLEGWSFMDAIYFSSMTTLTVGYGDLAVSSQTARAFSVGYMIVSVIVFAVAVGNIQAVSIARALSERRQEMLKKELDLEALFRLDEDGDGKVTLIEFVTGALHQLSGIDPEQEIHPWIRRFHELDTDGNGYLDQNDLHIHLSDEGYISGIVKPTGLHTLSLNSPVSKCSGDNCDQASPLLEIARLHKNYDAV